MDESDKQLQLILDIEAKHKGDNRTLISFWEQFYTKGGFKFNSGTHWTYRLVDLYYKEKRYDDAWRELNKIVLTKPNYLENTRKWQIKVLKKEKKDYAYIQQLLDEGR